MVTSEKKVTQSGGYSLTILPRGYSLQTEESPQTGMLRPRAVVSEKVSAETSLLRRY